HTDAVSRQLTVIDLWDNQVRQLNLDQLRASGGCATCRPDADLADRFPWLTGQRGSHTAVLCGRNSVQLSQPQAAEDSQMSLDSIGDKLACVGQVTRNRYLVRCAIGQHVLTLFPDGRAIVSGTSDPVEARTIYAKYIGA